MPRARTIAAVTAATLVLGGGAYVAADIYDVVPGVLTIDEPIDPETLPEPEPEPEVTGLVEVPIAGTGEALAALAADAPLPDPEELRTVLEAQLAQPGFYGSAGVEVTDALTGDVLFERDADRPVAPASTQKLLSGAAVLTTLDPDRRFTTSVVQTGPDSVVLVAGGDTMLAQGRGNPDAVEGYAGLADLAEQVVGRLTGGSNAADTTTDTTAAPPSGLTVSIDMSFAAGPRYSPAWNMEDIAFGYNQGVTMIGLAGQRPKPFQPSPREPELEAVKAFAAALTDAGIPATVADSPVLTTAAAGPRIATVRSATVAEITALAMDDSDNALTEALARLAAFDSGQATDFSTVSQFIVERVNALGIDTSTVTLLDASGMTYDQLVPARVISELINLATTGAEPDLVPLIADLPIGALTGTLHDRYMGDSTRAGAGVTRAKTGTINATIALAGTTLTRDGRLLTFTVIADKVPREGRLEARLALDRFVTALSGCGCRST